MPKYLATMLLLTLLPGCHQTEPAPLLGTLEWDRIALPAEVSEPVLAWHVAEGEQVAAGQLLLELDPRRLQAQLASAEANLAVAEAKLRELSHGARSETIAAAHAQLLRARAAAAESAQEYRRVAELRQRQLIAQQALDQAQSANQQNQALASAAEAQWRELANGTRAEQIEQASAAVAAARASRDQMALNLSRLSIKAPRAGRVDALPFKPGDQPPPGATVASLLVGDAPYARVFVPASARQQISTDSRFDVRIPGHDTAFAATLRSIRSEPSFTPYYALSGDDASRLVYRAELLLNGDKARQLPAGLPLEATLTHSGPAAP